MNNLKIMIVFTIHNCLCDSIDLNAHFKLVFKIRSFHLKKRNNQPTNQNLYIVWSFLVIDSVKFKANDDFLMVKTAIVYLYRYFFFFVCILCGFFFFFCILVFGCIYLERNCSYCPESRVSLLDSLLFCLAYGNIHLFLSFFSVFLGLCVDVCISKSKSNNHSHYKPLFGHYISQK